jgi:sigma-B regulation protein RsbU (phosphoserine phosphatase)
MASLQALLRSHAPLHGAAVRDLLADINRLMCSSTDSVRYATFFCGLYDDLQRTLTYVNAGHNAPMLVRAAHAPVEQVFARGQRETERELAARDADSSMVMRLETGGTAVGMFQNALYQQETVRMFPGDLLLIFSDGITEALSHNGEEFGEGRLVQLAAAHPQASAAALTELILRQLDLFVGQAPQQDDLTLVVAKVI